MAMEYPRISLPCTETQSVALIEEFRIVIIVIAKIRVAAAVRKERTTTAVIMHKSRRTITASESQEHAGSIGSRIFVAAACLSEVFAVVVAGPSLSPGTSS